METVYIKGLTDISTNINTINQNYLNQNAQPKKVKTLWDFYDGFYRPYDKESSDFTASDKQFYRYVTKLLVRLCDFVHTRQNCELVEMIKRDIDMAFSTEGNNRFCSHMQLFSSQFDCGVKSFYEAFNTFALDNVDKVKTMDFSDVLKLFQEKCINDENNHYYYCDTNVFGASLEVLINAAIPSTCMKWLQLKSMEFIEKENKVINKSNMMLTLPETEAELIFLYDMLVSRVYADTLAMACKDELDQSRVEAGYYEIQDKANQQFAEYRNIITDLDAKNKQLLKENSSLKIKSSALKNANVKYKTKIKTNSKEIIEENTDLIRDNEKLKQKNNEFELQISELKNKIKSLEYALEDATQINEDLSDELDEINKNNGFQLDTNGSYLFVTCDDGIVKERIEKLFPNSKIVHKPISFKGLKLDAVVMITSRIKHSTYYDIKSKCKNLGIPFVCTRSFNEEKLKEVEVPQI